jgi:hypothetical protein
MTSYYVSLGVLWIGLGALWLRRCLGAKKPLLLTMSGQKGERETKRARLFDGLLAVLSVGMGVSYLIKTIHLR